MSVLRRVCFVLLAALAAAGCSLSWDAPDLDGGRDDAASGDGDVGPEAEIGPEGGDDATPVDDGRADGDDADVPTDVVEDESSDAPGDEGDGAIPCSGPGDCVDGNACTNDFCIGDVCTYSWVTDGMPCTDDLFCNGGDRCASGVCEHMGSPCTDPPRCNEDHDWCGCDDGNACTTDDHVEVGGECRGTNADNTVCGRGCNASYCDRCCGGVCVGVTENARCGNCTANCSGAESCCWTSTSPCGWPWCCCT